MDETTVVLAVLFRDLLASQHAWLANWLTMNFDWASESVYFRVREGLKKMIVNKDFHGDIEGVKYAFMRLVSLNGEG